MSVQALSWALSQNIPNPAVKLVLVSLANHASYVDGTCFPSIKTIAKEASLSRRSVQRHLPALVELGFIRVEAHFNGSRQTANTYFLLMPLPSAIPGANLTPVNRADTPEGAIRGVDDHVTPVTASNRHNFRHTNLQHKSFSKREKKPFKQPKTISTRMPDQGRYEQELAIRLGDGGYEILASMEAWRLETLCFRQSRGIVTDQEIERLKFL